MGDLTHSRVDDGPEAVFGDFVAVVGVEEGLCDVVLLWIVHGVAGQPVEETAPKKGK